MHDYEIRKTLMHISNRYKSQDSASIRLLQNPGFNADKRLKNLRRHSDN